MDGFTIRERINWALPVGTGAGLLIVSLALDAYTPYAEFPLLFVVMPLVCISLLIALLIALFRKKRRLWVSAASALVIVIATAFVLLILQEPIRESLRWVLWSSRFEAELLSSPSPRLGELRHMEWQATGFAGVGNDTIYLVLDPTDALAPAAHTGLPGRYTGLPCEVLKVRRLEAHWYSVRFYADEEWGKRNQLDCSGIPSE